MLSMEADKIIMMAKPEYLWPNLIWIKIAIIIIMAKMVVILHGLATSNEGDAYGL